MPDLGALTFEERLGLLVDREMTERQNRKLRTSLKKAKLRLLASLEDLDYRTPRGLDKSLMLQLSSCQWIADHHHVLITGPTGVGKASWPAPWVIRLSHPLFRLPRLLQELAMSRGDGRYGRVLINLARTDQIRAHRHHFTVPENKMVENHLAGKFG